jgi:hypothetical protein
MNREIAGRLMWAWSPHGEVARFKTLSKAVASNFAKFCTSKNFPLYSMGITRFVFVRYFPLYAPDMKYLQ